MYIYKLPYLERKKLCTFLDLNNSFEELAAVHMQYDTIDVQMIRRELSRGNSPTEELLNMWGQQNHTVLELFVLLSRMKHYQAMAVIKSFVDTKYHFLIREGEPELPEIIADLSIEDNQRSEKILNNVPQIVIQNRIDKETVAVGGMNNLLAPRSPQTQLKTKQISADISTVIESAGGIPKISFKDLEKSTNNWHTSTILGKGGFGTVYKGTWKCTKVAIKKIEQKDSKEQIKQSITELHCLNACRHDNVLPLYGYSIDGPEPCVVYQYMAGGSLDHRLRPSDPSKVLAWPTRLNIAVGVARGLQYLHNVGEVPLVHGDIKSANILLDHNDTPRIGDFGLAREGPQSDMTYIKVTRIHGTKPYLPEEFLRNFKFSTKVDTYSFGVVLFELATGLGPYSERRKEQFLKNHVEYYEGDTLELKDTKAQGGETYFKALIEIGKWCVQTKVKDRPEMVSVLIQLEAVA